MAICTSIGIATTAAKAPALAHRSILRIAKMSTYTVANLPRISPSDLANLLKNNGTPDQPSDIAIIDVRDSDFIGGHIRGCVNVPVQTHDYRMPELVRTLAEKEMVVFHCMLSQQRGPSSALRYLRERERMGAKGRQKVVVLDGGFGRWQEK